MDAFNFLQVGLMQRQIESLQKQIGQIPAKPIVTAPPVERTWLVIDFNQNNQSDVSIISTFRSSWIYIPGR